MIDSIHPYPSRYKELPRCVPSRSCGDECIKEWGWIWNEQHLHEAIFKTNNPPSTSRIVVLVPMLKVYTSWGYFTCFTRPNNKGGCSMFNIQVRLIALRECRVLSCLINPRCSDLSTLVLPPPTCQIALLRQKKRGLIVHQTCFAKESNQTISFKIFAIFCSLFTLKWKKKLKSSPSSTSPGA